MLNDSRFGTENFAEELKNNSIPQDLKSELKGNFLLMDTQSGENLVAFTSSGLMLGGAGSSQEQIERTAWLFEFSTEGLGALADKTETNALKDALENFA